MVLRLPKDTTGSNKIKKTKEGLWIKEASIRRKEKQEYEERKQVREEKEKKKKEDEEWNHNREEK